MADQIVELEPGESKLVSFEAVPNAVKTYQVSINGLNGIFNAVAPPEVALDLYLSMNVIHSFNGICFIETGVDPDGVPYAITKNVTSQKMLGADKIEFTYIGKAQLAGVSWDGLWFSFRRRNQATWYGFSSINAPLGPFLPGIGYYWSVPFSGKIYVSSPYPDTDYDIDIGFQRGGAYRSNPFNTFRIKGAF